jgi:hypothetical protein
VQRLPHIDSVHAHLPSEHRAVRGSRAAHSSFTVGSSSTMPSQSLSSPSQTSAEGEHWQMSFGTPRSGRHAQPGTHAAESLHVVVQTLAGPVMPDPKPLWRGRQMPLVQSAFLEHGLPVSPTRPLSQTPSEQVSPPPHALPGQHASPAEPHAPPSPPPESEPEQPPDAQSPLPPPFPEHPAVTPATAKSSPMAHAFTRPTADDLDVPRRDSFMGRVCTRTCARRIR